MPILIEDGPYAGWMRWRPHTDDRFVDAALGPFYFKDEPDGSVRCLIEPGVQHTNGANILHGGFLMAFADVVYFTIAWRSLAQRSAVTLTAHHEFVSAGRVVVPLEAVGQVLKETGTLIFVRAVMFQNGGPVCATSATLRKLSLR